MDQFSEVRINHFDDIEGCWCVDAWKTDDDNEEGVVVAKIYEKSPIEFKVVWCDENLKNNPQINEEIDAFIHENYQQHKP